MTKHTNPQGVLETLTAPLSTEQAARVLAVKPGTLRVWHHRDRLQPVGYIDGRTPFYHLAALIAFVFRRGDVDGHAHGKATP